MDLTELLRGLLRRWYCLVAGGLVTVACCLLVFMGVAPTYEARASAVLLPPRSITSTSANPLLYLGGLSQALDVLTRSVGSEDTMKAVTTKFPDSTFTIDHDTTTAGPILLIVVDSPRPEEAIGGMNAGLSTVSDTLQSVQDSLNVAAKDRITLMGLAVDDKATELTKARTRAVLAIGALGLVLTVLLTGWIDGVIVRRAARTLVDDEQNPDGERSGTSGGDSRRRAAPDGEQTVSGRPQPI